MLAQKYLQEHIKMKKINPKDYNLPPRLNIQVNKKNELFYIIDRKSRIIMKDGVKIFNHVQEIRKKELSIKIILKTTAPVCSKTKAFLVEKGVSVVN
mgnify:CR=1 FL=1